MANKYPNNLKKYRKKRKLKQKRVAQILGLRDATNISRWENGVRIPDPINMFKLAALYRTKVDDLFMGLRRFTRNEIWVVEK